MGNKMADLWPNWMKRLPGITWIFAGSLLLLFIVVSCGGWWYIQRELSPPADQSTPVRFTIPAGADSRRITDLLQQKGLIRNQRMFFYYLRYMNEGDQFKAGLYEMTPGVTKEQIVERLNRGDVVKEEVLRFTIPEGFTIQQIADKLSELHYVQKDSFLQLTDTKLDYDSKWSSAIPGQLNLKHRLEGYLFPDTYELKKGSTAQDIVQRMLSEWDRKLEQLPNDWENKLKERGFTFHQALTVASLVEREVVVEEERPIVAGVIYNRLQKGMPLQIDAAIQYLFEHPKERLLEKDLQIESPYNTYLHTGLPPGPIASPSLSSLKAAIYPADTKYLFYVTKKDGTHTHLFAETFDEHKRNNTISKAN